MGTQLNRAAALEKCEAECDAAGYTKTLKLLNGDSSTETLSCKEGCKRGGIVISKCIKRIDNLFHNIENLYLHMT